jgi:hypothetical protein
MPMHFALSIFTVASCLTLRRRQIQANVVVRSLGLEAQNVVEFAASSANVDMVLQVIRFPEDGLADPALWHVFLPCKHVISVNIKAGVHFQGQSCVASAISGSKMPQYR